MSNLEATPGDAKIRTALRSMLRAKHTIDTDTSIIDELGLCRGQVRVDIAVVNGLIHGYEIKSDRDSLRRLDRQIEFYGKVLDRATLVVGNRHFESAAGLVPSWWGILRFHPTAEGLRFESIRKGQTNPSQDPRSLVELLWLDDAITLLDQHDTAVGFRGKPRRIVWDRICERIDVVEIANAVRNHLKNRPVILSPQ